MTSGSEARRRHLRLSIRFTEQELSALAAKARHTGFALSSYARFVLVGTKPLRTARRPTVEKELLARTLGQLGKIGSNINQIARVLNRSPETASALTSMATELTAVLDDLRALRAAVMKALGREVTTP